MSKLDKTEITISKRKFAIELKQLVHQKCVEINHYVSGCDSPFSYLQIADVQESLREIENTLNIKIKELCRMVTRIEKSDLARDALYEKVNTMVDELNTKIDNKDSLPSQTGKAGKFLTTDGTNASWGDAVAIILRQW